MPTALEMNNNSDHIATIYRARSDSRTSSVSSASSNDTSEELGPVEVFVSKENVQEIADKRRFRSMSDGSPTIAGQDEPFEVFPSLPDPVLEKMGLMANSPKERLNEEELEQKFVALALAFRIDAATIEDRCQRQRRSRDQTEKNLLVEIDRLTDRAYKLQQLCVDAETTELLTDLLAQVDVVTKAASHATISAERFGAVQHEDRLANGVQLMINHVMVLKQQRDSARKHLQYTKKVLQNTNTLDESQKPKSPQGNATPLLSKRRASIATIGQKAASFDSKMRIRRPSEMTFRASALPRTSRPSRLELGVDLVKIKEGTSETSEPVPVEEPKPELPREAELRAENVDASQCEQNDINLTNADKIVTNIRRISVAASEKFSSWSEDGTLAEMFAVATFICFALSLISLGNVLVELEYAKYNWNEPNAIATIWGNLFSFVSKFFESRSVVT